MKQVSKWMGFLFCAVLLTSCAPAQSDTGDASTTTTTAQVTVEDFVGMTANEAKQSENAAQYTFITKEENSDTVPAGEIIRQEPAAGTKADAGVTVTLTVSKGPATVQVPEIPQGESVEGVKIKLANAGLWYEFHYEPHESLQNNQVIRTEPAHPDTCPAGTVVKVYLCQN